MKTILTLILGFALLLSTAALISASAQEPRQEPPTGLEYNRSGAVPAPAGPMGHLGPGDMLTTPAERERLEKEQRERQHNPAAMDRQMDRTENELEMEGRR